MYKHIFCCCCYIHFITTAKRTTDRLGWQLEPTYLRDEKLMIRIGSTPEVRVALPLRGRSWPWPNGWMQEDPQPINYRLPHTCVRWSCYAVEQDKLALGLLDKQRSSIFTPSISCRNTDSAVVHFFSWAKYLVFYRPQNAQRNNATVWCKRRSVRLTLNLLRFCLVLAWWHRVRLSLRLFRIDELVPTVWRVLYRYGS